MARVPYEPEPGSRPRGGVWARLATLYGSNKFGTFFSPEVDDDDRKTTIAARKAPTVAEAETMGQLILLAEDNPTNQDVIRRQLTMLGYALEIASDGRNRMIVMRPASWNTI